MSDIPQITCESHDIEGDMGDSVTLSCEVRASPSASVRWYFDTGNETIDNWTDDDSWTVNIKVTTSQCSTVVRNTVVKAVQKCIGKPRLWTPVAP